MTTPAQQTGMKTKTKVWLGIGAVVVVFGAIGSLTNNGSSDQADAEKPDAATTPTAPASTPAPTPTATKPAVDWAGRIKKFQREDLGGAGAGFDWWSEVTGVTYEGSGLVVVATDIYPDSDAGPAATPICNAYSTIEAEYPQVTTVWVTSSQHGKIASC